MKCNACGRELEEEGMSMIGTFIELTVENELAKKYMDAVYPELPRDGFKVSVCYVCWLKSLGVSLPRQK